MSKKILEMKEKRAKLTNQIREIIDQYEGKELDPLKKEEIQNLEKDFDNVSDSIILEEKQIERERLAGEAEAQVIEQSNNEGENDKEKELINAFTDVLKNGTKEKIEIYNALQLDNPTQAGYIVSPQKFVAELIKEMDNFTFMRQISKVLPAIKGAHSLGYPKRTARASTFAWGTELGTPTADTSLAFGNREFKPHPATGELLVSKTLLRHSPMADGIVRDELAYDAAINLEQAYMTGSAAGQPLGVFTASSDGISTSRDVSTDNTATAMTFDGLKNAKYSLKEQYRNNDLNWIFHRDGIKQVAKIKDGNGQYIWQQSIKADEPDRLLNYMVRESEYAPNTFTTGLYVGLLGNFKKGYWIVDSLMMEIQVLMELYARTNQVDYIYRLETDAMPVMEECFARVKLG